MEEQEDGSFAATVHNAQPKALGAWLVAAAYDVRGAMVDLLSSYVGLTGNTSQSYGSTAQLLRQALSNHPSDRKP